MLQKFNLLFRDEHLVAIDKPAGYHVHRPEFYAPKMGRQPVCLSVLRRQLGQYVYPIHRLDAATTGVLLFALDRETASSLGKVFSGREAQKTYLAVVRGFVRDEAVVDLELESDSTGELMPAVTRYRKIAQVELPNAVGKRHASARYSLVEASPETGRYHQIRRHFNRISHPIIGDRDHGDSHHNKFFKSELQIGGLLLMARRLEFVHPVTQEALAIEAPFDERWQRVLELFRLSPDELIRR